jgi:uncharacterized membrane protein YccC
MASIATTTIAFDTQWGHPGGWLIMTPFIVLRPYVRDGWRKALDRGLGTIGGFAIAMVLAWLFGSGPLLTAFGFAFAILSAYAWAAKWSYAAYGLVLTPAVVIIESIGRPVETTADNRLEATLIAIAIVFVVIAAEVVLDRFARHREGSATTE